MCQAGRYYRSNGLDNFSYSSKTHNQAQLCVFIRKYFDNKCELIPV